MYVTDQQDLWPNSLATGQIESERFQNKFTAWNTKKKKKQKQKQ